MSVVVLELTYTAFGLLVVLLWMRALVDRACQRTPALCHSQKTLYQLCLLWVVVSFLKVVVIDDIIPPLDSRTHDRTARLIAEYLSDGEFAQASWYFGARNDGFRFFLGVFYALTGAPSGVVYGINGALAFWGLLSLLEICVCTTQAPRVPGWAVVMICASPTALFWTTMVTKEGPMLWAICMMLRLSFKSKLVARREGSFFPFLGFAVTAFLRPHIGAAWLAAIGAGIAIREMRVSVAITSLVGVAGAMAALQIVMPDVVERFQDEGVVSTMEERYEERNDIGGSAIQYAGGTPIPVLDGLLLILFRPYPTEIFNLASLMSGAEVWLIMAIMINKWFRVPGRLKLLFSPAVLTHIAALLLLSIFFTYLYNMGLMVRQRLQCFPAMLALVALPLLTICAVQLRQRQALRGPRVVPARRPQLRPVRRKMPLQRTGF